MTDRYASVINTPIGRAIAKRTGLPTPPHLERYVSQKAVIDGPVLLGAAPGGELAEAIAGVLKRINAETFTALDPAKPELRAAVAQAGLEAKVFNADAAATEQRFKALVFDAGGIAGTEQLAEAYRFLHPTIRRVSPSGRIVVLGTPPERAATPRHAAAQRALEGFVRSVAKECKRGATAQLVYVAPGAHDQIESTMRFLLSPRSAYVDGQAIRISASDRHPDILDWEVPLKGRVALVTGAARGIGREVGRVLARDGAHVVSLDVPGQEAELSAAAAAIGGSQLAVDITEEGAPDAIAEHLKAHHGGVDVVVHNAGITRDRTLRRMTAEQWDLVIAVNATSVERIDHALFERRILREDGRVVLVSSINGIAGSAGQTNYATSKAALIGLVDAYSGAVFESGRTLNAVAPGFIETQMTAQVPFAIREVGRRMNSLSQGGLPVDVAETIAWLASPASAGVNGNVVRVCGQSLLGA